MEPHQESSFRMRVSDPEMPAFTFLTVRFPALERLGG